MYWAPDVLLFLAVVRGPVYFVVVIVYCIVYKLYRATLVSLCLYQLLSDYKVSVVSFCFCRLVLGLQWRPFVRWSVHSQHYLYHRGDGQLPAGSDGFPRVRRRRRHASGQLRNQGEGLVKCGLLKCDSVK